MTDLDKGFEFWHANVVIIDTYTEQLLWFPLWCTRWRLTQKNVGGTAWILYYY